MKVRFRGTRGSIPIALTASDVKAKITRALMEARGKELRSEGQIRTFVEEELSFDVSGTMGGNTPCVEIDVGSEEVLVFDSGSGLRALGQQMLEEGIQGKTIHIFLSHYHFDHIQGIPFFAPAYFPGNKIVFHGGHDNLAETLRKQMTPPYFPVPIETMQAELSYEQHSPGDVVNAADCRITMIEQDHPGVSYGYRIEHGTAVAVYSTDAEHRLPAHGTTYPFVEFIKDADLLIFDAPYTLFQSIGAREDWGHSSNIMGVELAARANVKKLAIFHHDPAATDSEMEEFLRHTRKFLARSQEVIQQTRAGIPGAPQARKYPQEVLNAFDGLEIEL